MVATTARDDLAQFLRSQASQCLQLAHRTPNADIAAELLTLAALFHEQATRIEASPGSASNDSGSGD